MDNEQKKKQCMSEDKTAVRNLSKVQNVYVYKIQLYTTVYTIYKIESKNSFLARWNIASPRMLHGDMVGWNQYAHQFIL